MVVISLPPFNIAGIYASQRLAHICSPRHVVLPPSHALDISHQQWYHAGWVYISQSSILFTRTSRNSEYMKRATPLAVYTAA